MRSNFWTIYIDRSYPTGVEESEYTSYSKTLEMLEKNGDIVGPFKNLWPDYNPSCHFNDYYSYKYVNSRTCADFLVFVKSQNLSLRADKVTKTRVKNMAKELVAKFTITSSGDRSFKANKDSEKLLNQIVDNVIKLDQLVIKLQAKLMLDHDTAMNFMVEYCKFVMMAIKDPKKIYPSYTVELVWQTHFEFTEAYREFSEYFYNRFVKLPSPGEFDSAKSRKKYVFTKAHYERCFSYPPDPLVWEDEEDRFSHAYTKRMYVNVRRLCLTMSLKLVNPNFLRIPRLYKTGLKSDSPSTIQIKTNREDRLLISDKGKLYKWRRFYPNSSELYSEDKNITAVSEEQLSESCASDGTPKSVDADFFKNGGIIFVKDPADMA